MERFRDIYKGQTVWIIGKGPSLQYLTKNDIGQGPVITINESIIKVEEIGSPNPIYSMQKDGGNRRRYKNWRPFVLKPDCDHKSNCGDRCGGMYRPKKGATLLVHKHESLYCLADYSPRYVFDWAKLGLRRNRFSLVIAIKIGLLMGCKKFCFISFDAHTIGCLDSYTPNIGITRVSSVYRGFVGKVKRHIKNLDCVWITPKKGKKRKVGTMENLTFITPTGSRPLAFSLCQNWIKNQTLQPDQWIIIDDGKTPTKPVISLREILYLRRDPLRNDPKHTLLLNLRKALPYIKGDKIFFIEDDEYYAPQYVETMASKLDEHEVVGINNARYYYLPTSANCRCGNRKHASLAQTAFRKSFLQEFSRLVTTETGALDMKLWKKANNKNRGFLFLDDSDPLYVGMKGLPGRRGRGGSHTPESWQYKQSFLDVNKRLLRYWIFDDDDFKIYLDLMAGKLRTKNHLSYFLKNYGVDSE